MVIECDRHDGCPINLIRLQHSLPLTKHNSHLPAPSSLAHTEPSFLMVNVIEVCQLIKLNTNPLLSPDQGIL